MEKKENTGTKLNVLLCDLVDYVRGDDRPLVFAVMQEITEYFEQELDKAERRGEKRYEISLSEKADKPYIVIDDMKQGGKTVFAGTLEHIQINKLLEEENGKQNAR